MLFFYEPICQGHIFTIHVPCLLEVSPTSLQYEAFFQQRQTVQCKFWVRGFIEGHQRKQTAKWDPLSLKQKNVRCGFAAGKKLSNKAGTLQVSDHWRLLYWLPRTKLAHKHPPLMQTQQVVEEHWPQVPNLSDKVAPNRLYLGATRRRILELLRPAKMFWRPTRAKHTLLRHSTPSCKEDWDQSNTSTKTKERFFTVA